MQQTVSSREAIYYLPLAPLRLYERNFPRCSSSNQYRTSAKGIFSSSFNETVRFTKLNEKDVLEKLKKSRVLNTLECIHTDFVSSLLRIYRYDSNMSNTRFYYHKLKKRYAIYYWIIFLIAAYLIATSTYSTIRVSIESVVCHFDTQQPRIIGKQRIFGKC